MADNFEKKMQDILLRSEKNGGPDIRDVLEALVAKAEDDDDQHRESMSEIKRNRELFQAHLEDAFVFYQRVARCEERQTAWEGNCPRRTQAAVAEAVGPLLKEHAANHPASPRRRDDPGDADYSGDRRVWVMWNIGSRLTNILVAALTAALVVFVQWLLTGTP